MNFDIFCDASGEDVAPSDARSMTLARVVNVVDVAHEVVNVVDVAHEHYYICSKFAYLYASATKLTEPSTEKFCNKTTRKINKIQVVYVFLLSHLIIIDTKCLSKLVYVNIFYILSKKLISFEKKRVLIIEKLMKDIY